MSKDLHWKMLRKRFLDAGFTNVQAIYMIEAIAPAAQGQVEEFKRLHGTFGECILLGLADKE
jgi:hypothetical protein